MRLIALCGAGGIGSDKRAERPKGRYRPALTGAVVGSVRAAERMI